MKTIYSHQNLRSQVLATLGMSNESPEEQDNFLYQVESIAQQRMARVVPELLTRTQLSQAGAMKENGASDEAIIAWVERHIPAYNELLQALSLDVAEEAAHGGAFQRAED